ncbi:glycosyltransferase family 4 protein [Pseudoalteromonas sp. Z9A4]|jgi:glycosyltransferase involved in cell wall biosynthesis|uniref:glycosyltransferase family 4 protein n=1 Tax=Pseudoalteromonas sp. Z9A4 TaxID=2686353 RepID=UPI00140B837B|nr:glycosyltransferase family 4 protein [Pseudoalteromonas sp. Z9A4]
MSEKNKIKIGVAGLRGIPGVMGGVETHCEELYKRMSANFEILVYGRKGYVESSIISSSLKVKSLYSPKQQSLETPFHTLISILHCYMFSRVDVFHIHGIGGSMFLPLAKILFPKVLVTHHSQNYEHQKWGRLAKFVFKCGEKFALKYADKVFFVSKTLLDISKKRYPEKANNYQFMANGFSLPDLSVNVPDVNYPFFLAVGRLVPEKGFHDLVDAFNLYKGDEKLVIAGDTDFKSSYADNIRRNAGPNIIFLGRKSRSQLKWLYSNSKSFILPSYSEGLPISALEAVSCSAPVVMSDIVQNKDLGFPDDCYFKLGDINNLLVMLQQGGKQVDKRILGNYDWDKIAINYEKSIIKVTT